MAVLQVLAASLLLSCVFAAPGAKSLPGLLSPAVMPNLGATPVVTIWGPDGVEFDDYSKAAILQSAISGMEFAESAIEEIVHQGRQGLSLLNPGHGRVGAIVKRAADGDCTVKVEKNGTTVTVTGPCDKVLNVEISVNK